MENQPGEPRGNEVAEQTDAVAARTRIHSGLQYLVFLKQLSKLSRPGSYLEIGTRDGSSLAAFDCDAICVDPKMRPKPAALDRRRTFCFQMTSDRFFKETDLSEIFPTGVDVAFLDGMHRFEYVLRDFINTEANCHRRSMILVHDCFPPEANVAGRIFPRGGAWAGDVWKLVPILKESRGDLTLHMLDCPPTGLLLIQGISPSSESLEREYHSIVERYGSLTLDEYGLDRLWSDTEKLQSRSLVEDEALWSLAMATY